MAIKAIIVDQNMRYIETIVGKYNSGVLTYKRNQVNLVLFKFGGYEEEIEFDYEKLVDFGGKIGKFAIYQWDGKNLTQITLNEPIESSTTVDYVKNFKLGEYAKAAVLKRPEDTAMNVFKWVAVIAIVIASIVTIWNSNHAANVISQSAKNTPAQNISKQNAAVLDYLVKFLNTTSRRDNQTLAFMKNITQYLQLHGG